MILFLLLLIDCSDKFHNVETCQRIMINYQHLKTRFHHIICKNCPNVLTIVIYKKASIKQYPILKKQFRLSMGNFF